MVTVWLLVLKLLMDRVVLRFAQALLIIPILILDANRIHTIVSLMAQDAFTSQLVKQPNLR